MARPVELSRRTQVAVPGPVGPQGPAGPAGPTGPTGPAGPGGSGTVTHTAGALTADRLIIGNGTDDVKALASAGTATQVAHGGSPPTFSAVDLAADVTGTLPVGKGGTGAATLAAHGVLIGNAAGALAVSGAGTAGQVLTSNGASADPTFQAAASGAPVVQTTTLTGTQNDFALSAGCTVLRVNNASLVTFTGFAAGTDGQQVQIVSVGAGQVDLKHQDSGSAAANRTISPVTASISLDAGTGAALIEYDATTARWRVLAHRQGAWITRTFAAGNYTANGSMTWTVASATTDRYSLAGRTLTFSFLATGTIGGTLNTTVMVAIPGGFVAANTQSFQILTTPASGTQQEGVAYVSAGATVVSCALNTSGAGNWTAGSGTVNGTVTIEVQ